MIEDKEKFEGQGFDCRVEYEPGSDGEAHAGRPPPVPGDHDGGGVCMSEEPERVRRPKRTPRRFTGKPGTVQCTANSKWRMKESLLDARCRNQAVLGKDKCPWHGGNTPIKHGLRSKYAPQGLAGLVEEVRNNPAILKLDEEVALMMALKVKALEKACEDNLSGKSFDALLRVLSESSEAKYKRAMLTQGLGVSIDVLAEYQNDFIEVVEEEVGCLETKRRIKSRLLERWRRKTNELIFSDLGSPPSRD
jgi:hypothetical protein